MQARARFLLFFVKKMKINLHNSKKSSTFALILKNKSNLTLNFPLGIRYLSPKNDREPVEVFSCNCKYLGSRSSRE